MRRRFRILVAVSCAACLVYLTIARLVQYSGIMDGVKTDSPGRQRGILETRQGRETWLLESTLPQQTLSQDETSHEVGFVKQFPSWLTSEDMQADKDVVKKTTTDTLPGPRTRCHSNAEEKNKSSCFSSKVNTMVPVFLNRVNRTISNKAKRWWSANMHERYTVDGIITKLLEVVPGKSSFHEVNKTCISCAIVGNAGNLLGSGYGTLIDSQDVIIRSNRSPTEGYENDVGSLTTHQILYPESGEYYHRGVPVILLPFKSNDLKWLTTIFSTRESAKGFWKQVVQILPEAKPEDAYIIHPEFLHYVQTKWLVSDHKQKWPSAGIVALILGLHLCDELHVMGFGISKSGLWDHYYDTREHRIAKPVQNVSHAADLEAAVRNQMKVDNVLKLYPGNQT